MKNLLSTLALTASLALISTAILADNHGMKGHDMMEGHGDGHMMDNKQHEQMMRQVEGMGQLNKVMGDHHMINVTHEPMAELGWPKMRMNFKTAESVDLSDVEEGDQVRFTLEVDADDNYRIIDIEKQ